MSISSDTSLFLSSDTLPLCALARSPVGLPTDNPAIASCSSTALTVTHSIDKNIYWSSLKIFIQNQWVQQQYMSRVMLVSQSMSSVGASLNWWINQLMITHSPCDERGSQSNHRMPASFLPCHRQMFAALQSYCLQLTARGSPTCYCCGHLETTSQLEVTFKKTQPHLASCSEGRRRPTEYWPHICLE